MDSSLDQQPSETHSSASFARLSPAARLIVHRDGVIEQRIVLGKVAVTAGRAPSNDLVLSYEGGLASSRRVPSLPGRGNGCGYWPRQRHLMLMATA